MIIFVCSKLFAFLTRWILLIDMEHDCYKLLEDGKKKCYGCQTVKSINDFCKDKRGIGGIKNNCRTCTTVWRKQHYAKNKDVENKMCREYKKKNAERCKELNDRWKKENPDKVKARKRRYYLENMKNPKFRIENNMARAINKRVKLEKQDKKLKDILGYSTDELMTHLESKFKPEMNWENQGKYWHIDHIRPKSWFKYESVADPEFKACWALSNLQPLEASINCSKQARYEG